MATTKLELIIEHGDDTLWGRVSYNDNLIVDEAGSVTELENKLKNLLHEIEGVDPDSIQFENTYDVYALFEKFDFLNITKVARYANINAALLRQYASGVKHPSLIQAKKIESTIHKLAEQMQKVSVYAE